MVSATDMKDRINSINRVNYELSYEQCVKLEELALMDEILQALRRIAAQLAHMDMMI